jgi:hypothetical protein
MSSHSKRQPMSNFTAKKVVDKNIVLPLTLLPDGGSPAVIRHTRKAMDDI